MRRKDLEVLDKERLVKVLDGCKVCRLGISDEVPYIVPMNFGYSWDDRLTLYFHSAPRGRKLDLMRQNPRVSFEMDCDHQLVAGSTACRYSYRYSSLMGAGKVRFLEDAGEKLEALRCIMRQVTGTDDYEYDEPAVRSVAVFAVDATEVIGKIR
jgi:nitroimidazol reductase NimA-like FMN-containing flavoprotein (pyridoxamine 5'-phosphate oxidase superfamily)